MIGAYTPLSYPANVGTTVFNITFPYQNTSHIKPYLDGVLILSGFTVSPAGETGTITFSTAPVGTTLLIRREVPFDQISDFQNQGTFLGKRHEDTFDRIVMQTAELDYRLSELEDGTEEIEEIVEILESEFIPSTHGEGTLFLGTSYAILQHNLEYTPNIVLITPGKNFTADYGFWVSDITATTFKINVTTPVLIDFMNFYWEAVYDENAQLTATLQDASFIYEYSTNLQRAAAGRLWGYWRLHDSGQPSGGYQNQSLIITDTINVDYEFAALGGYNCFKTVNSPSKDIIAYNNNYNTITLGIAACCYVFTNKSYNDWEFQEDSFVVHPAGFTLTRDSTTQVRFVNVSSPGTFDHYISIPEVLNQWVHWTISLDTRAGYKTAKVYVDGLLVFSTYYSPTSFSYGYVHSCRVRSVSTGESIHGYRNYRVYSRSLTAAEVLGIKNEDLAS